MDFSLTKSNKYNKDYGIIVHNHFRSFVISISFGVYNWRMEWLHYDSRKLELIGVCVYVSNNNIRFIYKNEHGKVLLIGEDNVMYNSFSSLCSFKERKMTMYYTELPIFKDTKLARKIYPNAKEFKKGWLYVKDTTK